MNQNEKVNKPKYRRIPEHVMEAAFEVAFLAYDTASNVIAGSDPEFEDTGPDERVRDQAAIYLKWYTKGNVPKNE